MNDTRGTKLFVVERDTDKYVVLDDLSKFHLQRDAALVCATLDKKPKAAEKTDNMDLDIPMAELKVSPSAYKSTPRSFDPLSPMATKAPAELAKPRLVTNGKFLSEKIIVKTLS